MRQAHDDTRRYRGIRRDGGCCCIAVYIPAADEAERRPVMVASERYQNDGAAALSALSYESDVRMRRLPAIQYPQHTLPDATRTPRVSPLP